MSDPARVFAVLAAIAGVAFTCALPPSAAPDESRHLSRVYLMSEGRFAVPGTTPPRVSVPKSLGELHRAVEGEKFRHPPRRSVREVAALAIRPLEPERRAGVANAGTYPPLVYLPHLVGVAPARWIGLGPAGLIWAGRLTSLAAWIALTAFAIRLAPARRWTLVLLSLTPTAVASAASISADPVTNAAVLLFTVIVMRAVCGAGALARDELLALLCSALFLGLVKPGYAPLALAVLAIPAARTGGRARLLALTGAVAAAIAIPMLTWAAHAQAQAPAPPTPYADASGQIASLLADPIYFAKVLHHSFRVFGPSYWTSAIGELGPLIVSLPIAVYVGFTALLVATIALDGPLPAPLAGPRRGYLVLGVLLTGLAVFVFSYVGWNRVGARFVAGVQGRSLAPALPLLVFALPARRAPLPPGFRKVLIAGVVATFVATAIAIFGVYYRW